LNADPRERLFDLVELEWFNNRFDLLHIVSSLRLSARTLKPLRKRRAATG
jgi:hypothetical protein